MKLNKEIYKLSRSYSSDTAVQTKIYYTADKFAETLGTDIPGAKLSIMMKNFMGYMFPQTWIL